MNKAFVSFFIFLLFVLSLGVDALTVSSTSPSANALNVSQTPDISVVFSTPVDDSTLTDSTVRIQSSLSGSILS
ncbi:MAG: Ig-like domain-containing protein, partial [Candidatus Poribacteria bacterium]|nr:Ig-like domain-containing protein [Candidatus Poribacteria bacterium]